MSLKRHKREHNGDIDISPLIDVVFILLIFFMVSTTFIKDAQIPIDRPGAQSGSRANAEALRIYLDRGIYAEATLFFRKGTFEPLPWTFQDFQRPDYIAFLNRVRDSLYRDIRTTSETGN